MVPRKQNPAASCSKGGDVLYIPGSQGAGLVGGNEPKLIKVAGRESHQIEVVAGLICHSVTGRDLVNRSPILSQRGQVASEQGKAPNVPIIGLRPNRSLQQDAVQHHCLPLSGASLARKLELAADLTQGVCGSVPSLKITVDRWPQQPCPLKVKAFARHVAKVM